MKNNKPVRALLKDKNGIIRTYYGGYALIKKSNCVAAWSTSTGKKF